MAEKQSVDEAEKENLPADDVKKSPFSDAVYKELAKINGRINQMTKDAIIRKLKQCKLSTEGSHEILKKRLKNYYKTEKLQTHNLLVASKLHPYYVIVDFEATCEEVNSSDYPHEIIEFPAVLVSTEKLEIVDHFQAYCKPIVNPKLSDFCVELTGITQEKVDNSQPFDEVLESFEAWLKKHKLGSKFKYGVVTDGPWDMGRFLYGQCKISGVPYPRFGNKWINIRKIFSSFYKSKRYCLRLMLEHLDIGFEGRPHCGLDDARNIARILLRLISDGASIQVNERIHLTRCNSKSRGSDGQVEKLVVSIPSNRPTKDYTRVHRDRCRREKKQQQQQQREHTGVSDMESDGSSKETECEDSKNEDKKLGT
ncbi:3'-5' exoribonuclease 1 isoform X2 [Anabrus simplex]|uniref:3'-5' exoribonuclease 1 isoform X2 n=1 Tax=Anabrus simplex TaxID=316456 RepID=UPI0034DCEC47